MKVSHGQISELVEIAVVHVYVVDVVVVTEALSVVDVVVVAGDGGHREGRLLNVAQDGVEKIFISDVLRFKLVRL